MGLNANATIHTALAHYGAGLLDFTAAASWSSFGAISFIPGSIDFQDATIALYCTKIFAWNRWTFSNIIIAFL
jgi:hypothetical protein